MGLGYGYGLQGEQQDNSSPAACQGAGCKDQNREGAGFVLHSSDHRVTGYRVHLAAARCEGAGSIVFQDDELDV